MYFFDVMVNLIDMIGDMFDSGGYEPHDPGDDPGNEERRKKAERDAKIRSQCASIRSEAQTLIDYKKDTVNSFLSDEELRSASALSLSGANLTRMKRDGDAAIQKAMRREINEQTARDKSVVNAAESLIAQLQAIRKDEARG